MGKGLCGILTKGIATPYLRAIFGKEWLASWPNWKPKPLPSTKARHDYFVEESFETGIVLAGTEVKSLRAGITVNLKDSWCDIENGEIFVKQMHISPYEKGNIFNKDPMRTRKLLMHRREIHRLLGLLKQEGIP